MPRALITGITGQDGLYLSELLLAKGYEVLRPDPRPEQPEARAGRRRSCPRSMLLTGDLTDLSSLMRALDVAAARRGLQPRRDLVRGLLVGERPADHRGHRQGRAERPRGRPAVLRATTRRRCASTRRRRSEMFGKVQEVPQRENDAAVAALAVRRRQGLRPLHDHQLPRVLRHARLLRHPVQPRVPAPRTGVRHPQGRRWRSPRSRSACRTSITLGNLDAKRDWGFAGDYVEAMWRMLQQPEADDYVLATGETHSIRELLDLAFARVGIDDWPSYVEQDPRFFRPAEVDLLIGDASKAREQLGWKPQVASTSSSTMMVDNDLALQRGLDTADERRARHRGHRPGRQLPRRRLLAEGVEVHGLVAHRGPRRHRCPTGLRRRTRSTSNRPRRARRARRAGRRPTRSTTSAGSSSVAAPGRTRVTTRVNGPRRRSP